MDGDIGLGAHVHAGAALGVEVVEALKALFAAGAVGLEVAFARLVGKMVIIQALMTCLNKTTCKSIHLDTMEAQTASLHARAGEGLRVTMRRRKVGASRRGREPSQHLKKWTQEKFAPEKVDSRLFLGVLVAHLMLWRVPAQL